MDSNTTLKLPSKKQPRKHNQDRISQLPDPIIHHIFRFLPIREAIQSGILAKRWMNLWASMQWMEFNSSEFCDNEKFECFIDKVLMLRKPFSLDTFCLDLGFDFDENHANMWILYAINHNVRVLHLWIDLYEDCKLHLPHCLSAYDSLEELRVDLGICQKISRLSFAESCRLKRLQFCRFIFNYNDLQKLISGCHWLEVLELEYCHVMDDDSPRLQSSCLHVSSKTMKTLRIQHCYFQSMIRFWIPSLISLHYQCSNVEQASFVNLSSLVHAFISDRDDDDSAEPIELERVADLINGVSNAKILKLFGWRIEFIYDKKVQNRPTFPNLERLTIGSCYVGNNFEAVMYFLRCSPKLEHLTLEQLKGPESGTEVSQRVRNISFECPHLKIIEMSGSKTDERILEFVKALLENAEALQKIVIYP